MRRAPALLVLLVALAASAATVNIPVENSGTGVTIIPLGCVSCGASAGSIGRETYNFFAWLSGPHLMAADATLKNLRCDAYDVSSAWAGTDKITYTVWIDPDGWNGGDAAAGSSITCPTAGGASTQDRACTDLSNTEAVLAGAVVWINITLTDTPPNASHTCSIEVHI